MQLFYSTGNTIEDDDYSVSTLLEKANRNVGMFILTATTLQLFISFDGTLQYTGTESKKNITFKYRNLA